MTTTDISPVKTTDDTKSNTNNNNEIITEISNKKHNKNSMESTTGLSEMTVC